MFKKINYYSSPLRMFFLDKKMHYNDSIQKRGRAGKFGEPDTRKIQKFNLIKKLYYKIKLLKNYL